jgi:hypothetical protein
MEGVGKVSFGAIGAIGALFGTPTYNIITIKRKKEFVFARVGVGNDAPIAPIAPKVVLSLCFG